MCFEVIIPFQEVASSQPQMLKPDHNSGKMFTKMPWLLVSLTTESRHSLVSYRELCPLFHNLITQQCGGGWSVLPLVLQRATLYIGKNTTVALKSPLYPRHLWVQRLEGHTRKRAIGTSTPPWAMASLRFWTAGYTFNRSATPRSRRSPLDRYCDWHEGAGHITLNQINPEAPITVQSFVVAVLSLYPEGNG